MTRLNEFGQPVGDPLPGWTPASYPPAEVLTGRWVSLEPLQAEHAVGLWDAFREAPEQAWTYLSVHPPQSVEDVEEMVREMRAAPTVPYAVLVDDSPQGVMSLMRIDPDNGVIEIGFIHFGPSLARTTAATEAHRLLMGHAFDLGYRRVEWKCDVLNAPSMQGARRLGYTYEGTFRNAVITKGRNRDTAWWSMTDDEWRTMRQRLDLWLDPTNFDVDGHQLRKLSQF